MNSSQLIKSLFQQSHVNNSQIQQHIVIVPARTFPSPKRSILDREKAVTFRHLAFDKNDPRVALAQRILDFKAGLIKEFGSINAAILLRQFADEGDRLDN